MFNLQKAIIPTPVKLHDEGGKIKIASLSKPEFSFDFAGSGDVFDEAKAYLTDKFSNKYSVVNPKGSYKISLVIDKDNDNFKDINKSEAYFISITKDEAVLCGADEAGAYYAAISFMSLVHKEKNDVYIPMCFILDYPKFQKRGHFMECRYGSDFMSYSDWTDAIDYLSETKINTIIMGLYGCWGRQYDNELTEYLYVPIKKYPEMKTPRHIKYYSAKNKSFVYKKDVLPTMFEEDSFGDIIAYAKKKNIKIIPLFNSLGHNTLLPRLFPEISAINEKGEFEKFGFCTQNEKTFEVLFNIYDEMIDRYLTPNGIDSFSIGLDEVLPYVGIDEKDFRLDKDPVCKCSKCSGRDYGELMIDYIIKITKHLVSKGIKNVYVYHDMLFNHNALTPHTVQKLKDEGVYENIIIDWWSYNPKGRNFRKREDEVNGLFRSVGKPITGYFHWSMPTQMNENIYAITEISEKNNFEGIISYGAFEYCYDFNYRVLAECAWRGTEALSSDELLQNYALQNFAENADAAYNALKYIQDISIGRYSGQNYCANFLEYYTSSYLQRNLEYPQDYPANAMRKIKEDEEKYLAYLNETLLKAENAYNFFSKNDYSNKSSIWALVSFTYKVLCSEFLKLYTMDRAYKDGIIDEHRYVDELESLICQRDELISLLEDVRIEANTYTAARDMTVSRQLMLDLKEYIEAEIKKGKKPAPDIFKFDEYLSDYSRFLR